jgi:hypothetical protein
MTVRIYPDEDLKPGTNIAFGACNPNPDTKKVKPDMKSLLHFFSSDAFLIKTFQMTRLFLTTVLASGSLYDTGIHTVKADISGLPTGVYFCRITAENILKTEKPVIKNSE